LRSKANQLSHTIFKENSCIYFITPLLKHQLHRSTSSGDDTVSCCTYLAQAEITQQLLDDVAENVARTFIVVQDNGSQSTFSDRLAFPV